MDHQFEQGVQEIVIILSDSISFIFGRFWCSRLFFWSALVFEYCPMFLFVVATEFAHKSFGGLVCPDAGRRRLLHYCYLYFIFILCCFSPLLNPTRLSKRSKETGFFGNAALSKVECLSEYLFFPSWEVIPSFCVVIKDEKRSSERTCVVSTDERTNNNNNKTRKGAVFFLH